MDDGHVKSAEISSAEEVKIPEASKFLPTKANLPKIISDYFVEYTGSTGIHGVKYLGEKGRSVVEKFWWLLVLSFCVYKCVDLILPTLKKWEENPVFISFSQTPLPVWKVPFPAVTFCPEHKIKQSKFNISYYYYEYLRNNLTDQDLRSLADTFLMCPDFPFHSEVNHSDMETINFLLEAFPSLNEVMHACWWSKDSGCESMVSPIFTNEGLCFSFNMIDRKELFTNITYIPEDHVRHRKTSDWSFDHGYTKAAKDAFPIRFKLARREDALKLIVDANKSEVESLCNVARGFKILLHHPAEVPRFATRYFQASYKNYDILIKPIVTITSSDLLHYDPHRRKCFYSKERQLKFFQIYTQENCLVECMANYTLQECGCVKYYMPRELSTKICRSNESNCAQSVEREVLEQEFSKDDGQDMQPACDCLSSCTSITYDADVYQTNERSMDSATFLKVFFKDAKFTATERNELFGETDFWANCGGLLGLFTGLSVVSVVEVIYFLTIRWMCNIRNFTKYFRFVKD